MQNKIPSKKIHKRKIPDKIPRPLNSFMIYRQDNLKNFSYKTAAELSIAIGEQWKSEPPSVRAHYSELAKEARLKHEKEHPQYKFTPKKRRPSCPKPASKENEPKKRKNIGRLVEFSKENEPQKRKNIDRPVEPSKENEPKKKKNVDRLVELSKENEPQKRKNIDRPVEPSKENEPKKKKNIDRPVEPSKENEPQKKNFDCPVEPSKAATLTRVKTDEALSKV